MEKLPNEILEKILRKTSTYNTSQVNKRWNKIATHPRIIDTITIELDRNDQEINFDELVNIRNLRIKCNDYLNLKNLPLILMKDCFKNLEYINLEFKFSHGHSHKEAIVNKYLLKYIQLNKFNHSLRKLKIFLDVNINYYDNDSSLWIHHVMKLENIEYFDLVSPLCFIFYNIDNYILYSYHLSIFSDQDLNFQPKFKGYPEKVRNIIINNREDIDMIEYLPFQKMKNIRNLKLGYTFDNYIHIGKLLNIIGDTIPVKNYNICLIRDDELLLNRDEELKHIKNN